MIPVVLILVVAVRLGCFLLLVSLMVVLVIIREENCSLLMAHARRNPDGFFS